ncbi:MAG: hypothetical protein IKT55_07850 [Clostridia bacterium]|nr:hypothetical protein [Clostridia bacterium]
MNKALCSNSILSQLGSGITGAMLTGALALSVCAVTGGGLFAFVLCCVVCFVFSAINKSKVFAPHVFLLLPLFYVLSNGSTLACGLSVALGGLFYLCLTKFVKKAPVPDFIASGMGLGIAVGVTILLTNAYFGIGANSFIPFDMLKEFRSLGFHPNFRGLFYGTITLFAMITYPFKFKRLNRYLPAAFVTLLIPYVFNLFLNPHRDFTTINESASLIFADGIKTELSSFLEISVKDIPYILKGSVGFGAILFVFGDSDTLTCPANCTSGLLSGIPVKAYPIKGYGTISAVTSTIIIVLLVLLCPSAFSRLPLHCAGAMLIVSAWQSLPTASLKALFKERNFIKIIMMVLCGVVFVLTDIFTSVLAAFILWAIFGKPSKKEVN